jgi:hypothetical protein
MAIAQCPHHSRLTAFAHQELLFQVFFRDVDGALQTLQAAATTPVQVH